MSAVRTRRMGIARHFALMAAYAAAVIVAGVLADRAAHAFRSTQPQGVLPNTNAVFGASGLADPGLAINASTSNHGCISFNGNGLTDYICDTNAGVLNMQLNSGVRLALSPAGLLTLTDNNTGFAEWDSTNSTRNVAVLNASNNLVLAGTGVTQINMGSPVGWNNGTDITETNGPRFGACAYTGSISNAAATWGLYRPTLASHIKAVALRVETAGAGCTTAPVVSLRIQGTAQAGTAMTLTNTINQFSVQSLNLAVTAGQLIDWTYSTLGSGCTTNAQLLNACAEMTTD